MRWTAKKFLIFFLFTAAAFPQSNTFAQDDQQTPSDQHSLAIKATPGEFQNATVQAQYIGSISIDESGDEEQPKLLPLNVKARFRFDQQLSGSGTKLQAVRYYSQAKGDIKAGQGKKESVLNDSNKYVVGRIMTKTNNQNQFQFASIASVLTQSEYELIKHPADPLTLIGLIDRSAKINETWKADDIRIGRFLGVDRVISSTIQFKLKSVKNNIAKVQLFGDLKGEVDDAITEITVSGDIAIDTTTDRALAVRVTFNQLRDPGRIAPGFDGQVKIDVRLKSIESSTHLTKAKLGPITHGKKVKQVFLLDSKDSEFSLVYAPEWRTIIAEQQAAVLRYIENGDLLAQCNIVQLPNRPANNLLKLKDFEARVKKMLTKADIKITSSKSAKTLNGLSALRVAVDGQESGIPIQWLYYHVANNEGQQLTFVFTMEKDVAERFATADQTLVNQVSFKPAKPRQSKKADSNKQR